MAKGLPRSLSRGANRLQSAKVQTFTARALALEVDGATGVGFGTVVLGDFPEGNLLFLGAAANMRFSGPTSASLTDTWSGDYGIGTIPMADATLADGDVDIIQSTAVGPAVAEVSPVTRGTHLPADAGEIHDNTDGSLELNLNVLVDDADISGDDIAMTVDGELYLSYIVLGDD